VKRDEEKTITSGKKWGEEKGTGEQKKLGT
jgi:hypothetical protein